MTLIEGRSETAAPAPSRPPRVGAELRDAGACGVLGAIAGAVLFLLTHRAFTDDAMITVTYARTLAESGTWGVIPGLPANTQTSPLNLLALAAVTVVVRSPVIAVGVVLMAALALVGWWGVQLAGRVGVSHSAAVALLVLLATSPVLVGTVGLETYLAAAVLVGIARYAVAGRAAVTGLLVGAAVLVRPDLAVPAAVCALLLVTPRAGTAPRRLAVAAAAAVAVALPWHLFAWWALGGFVPDTVWTKTMVGGPTMLGGIVDFWGVHNRVGTAMSALPVVAALACAGWWSARDRRHPAARVVVTVVAAGWAHLLALAAIDACGASWYYGPLAACSATAVALTAGALGARVAGEVTAVVLAGALVAAATWDSVPWTWLPVVANVATTEQYAGIGRELGALTGGEPVQSPGEVGGLAYHATVPVLDHLTDPARMDEVLSWQRESTGPLRRAAMDLAGAGRAPQPVPPLRWVLVFGREPPPVGQVVRVWTVSTPVRGEDTVTLLTRW